MDQFHPLAAGIQLSQEERVKFHWTNIIFHLEQLQEMKVLGLSTKDQVLNAIDGEILRFGLATSYYQGMLVRQPTLHQPMPNKHTQIKSAPKKPALNPLAHFQAPGHLTTQVEPEPKSPAQEFALRAAKLNIRIASADTQAPGRQDGELSPDAPKGGEGLHSYLAEDDDLIDLFSPCAA